MCHRQPAAQLSGRFVRRAPIERHRGGGAAGTRVMLRAPFASPTSRLRSVLASVDDSVEAMRGFRSAPMEKWIAERSSLAAPPRQTSERTIEGASTKCTGGDLSDESYEKNLWLSQIPQRIHGRCTTFPQLEGAGRGACLTSTPEDN